MAIIPVDTGVAAGTTSIVLPVWSSAPGIVVPNRICFIVVANKLSTTIPDLPTGFTAAGNYTLSGGGGTNGEDDGPTRITIFYRVHDGTESGSVTVTIPSGNSAVAGYIHFRNDDGGGWSIANDGGGADTSRDTSWSSTGSFNIGFLAGDKAIWFTASTNQNGHPVAESMSAGPAVFESPATWINSGTTLGNNIRLALGTFDCTTGTGGVAMPTITDSNTLAATTGVGMVTRLRSVVLPPMQPDGVASAESIGAPSVGVVVHPDAIVDDRISDVAVTQQRFYVTPTIREPYPWGEQGLFRYYLQTEGVTWYKVGGVWNKTNYPSDDLVADEVYHGGREYEVTSEKATELQALGFTLRTEIR